MLENQAAQGQQPMEGWKRALFRWLVFIELLALFGFAYISLGGQLITQTNRTDKDIHGGDQMHNMRLATETRADLHPDLRRGFVKPLLDFFPHRTDGVVQPLWPWVASWLTEAGHRITEEDMAAKEVSDKSRELFNRGRWFQVFMTLAFLVMLGIAACRIFTLPAACNLVLLGGLGALLPRAAFFQPEPLYFIFFFLTWVACATALQHNTLWIYGVVGVLGGLAYMTKGSVAPLLAVFVGVSTLRCVWELISARRRGLHVSHANVWHWRNHLVGLVVLGAAHLMTIGPRLSHAHEKFGDPLHSYPSYWMWLDSFGGPPTVDDARTCYGWMARHNTKEELAAMLPSERPSFSNYLRTHSRGDFFSRLWEGTQSKVGEFFWPRQTKLMKNLDKWSGWRGILEWRGLYLLWLALILLTLVIVVAGAAPKAQHAGHFLFRHGTGSVLLFVVASCVLYSLAYGFYSPIAKGSGDRFMLSLYLPLAFSLIWGAEYVIRRMRRRKASPWITRGYLAAQWVLTAAITWRVVEILRLPKFYNG